MSGNKSIKISYRTTRKINGIVLLLPWLIGFFLFFMIPLVQSVVYSFHSIGVADQGGMVREWVGIQNYSDLFVAEVSTDNQPFLRVFIDENIRILINTPIIVIFSLFSALLINTKFKGRGPARVVFFLPIVIGLPVVLNLISVTTGGDMVDSSLGAMFSDGAIYRLIREYSFLPRSVSMYIASAAEGIFDLVFSCGVQTLILLAGLQSIDKSLYEVAKIEGANSYEIFWKITLPMLLNVITFAIVYSFVDLFLTSSLTQEIYAYAFIRNNIGMGSALGLIYMLVVILELSVALLIINKVVKQYG